MKVVLDTNVLLSALIFPGGPPEKIVGLARLREIQVFLSPDILTELRKVLRKKFQYSEEETEEFIQRILTFAQLVYPTERLQIIMRVDADNRILECARESGADFIVTGDKRDLLPLKMFGNAPILAPAPFLDLFSQKK